MLKYTCKQLRKECVKLMYKIPVDNYKMPGDYLGFTIGRNIPDYFPEDYVVLDLETTGLDPEQEEIIEICALRYSDNVKVDTFTKLVKPSKPVPFEITQLTGISNTMLENAEDLSRALCELQAFVGNSLLVGFCVFFDVRFLFDKYKKQHNLIFYNWYIDVHDLAKKYLPGLERYRQVDVCRELKISSKGAHRAEKDCLMCNNIFQRLKEKAIAGYKEPAARTEFYVSRNGQERLPFKGKSFLFVGTFEQVTKYNMLNIVIGLGGSVDSKLEDNTAYVIVGLAEEGALHSEALLLAGNRKRLVGNMYIFKEKRFVELLKAKGFLE